MSGDLHGALGLASRKAELAERIAISAAPERSTLDAMRKKAERNGALLKAAQDGLDSARERVRAILSGVATRTYSADGSRTEIPVDRVGLERRA
ncbi:hypothetical protein [Palleronia sp. THAF1]|uniref:hypothetical protein n=1 Tax=Palleronia sp. THAF1 TaxID=2587842 RepID=UPI000F534563|nr:hypothetical protein [Palleronia sp. THAF1]